ncbi:hypothetical protein Q8A67_003267 [Cirrhinus molitorella]|uniref:Uncharacterized protein n=1 Tax=Cirrhinus molitorella TaxID=172907 RepID=A0AA88Q2T9_9TELE|nr:hypothetical protein Q8A67_003267 [Cirrhinus molitorella]
MCQWKRTSQGAGAGATVLPDPVIITDAEADGGMSYQHGSEKKHHLIRGCSKQSGLKKKSTSDPHGTPDKAVSSMGRPTPRWTRLNTQRKGERE